MSTKMKLLLLVALLVSIPAVMYFGSSKNNNITSLINRNYQNHEVLLTDNGFSPKELDINIGDTVIFKTRRDKPFWPASDLHPTHTIYPEFDPKRPIEPNETWSFRFEKQGTWKYHDHLSPLFKGVITVKRESSGSVKILSSKCQPNDTACINDALDKILEEEGVESAFELVASLYESGASGDCHAYAHKIGEKAYKLFSQANKLTLGRKTYYCGYGFYHSFMETLLQERGDTKLAHEFCNYTIKSTGLPSAWTACYHGIGHGSVDGSDPRTWSDASAMMKAGFDICDTVSDTPLKRYLCASGIYNAMDVLSGDPKYKITEIQKQPFKLCYTQPEDLREPCYTNMTPPVLRLTKGDFQKAAQYIEENIKDPEAPTIDGFTTREMVVLSLFHEYVRAHGTDKNFLVMGVDLCRSLPEHSRLACIEGLSGGHMKYGEPEKEYVKWREFCVSPKLLDDEKDSCYKYVLNRILNWYTKEKAMEICQSVPGEYSKKYCKL